MKRHRWAVAAAARLRSLRAPLTADDFELIGTALDHFGDYLSDQGHNDYEAVELIGLAARLAALGEKIR